MKTETNDKPAKTCANCRYFERFLDLGFGWCHRYPAVPLAGDDGQTDTRFPEMPEISWCG